jgi:microcompartment protein CcmL/EutN
MNAVGLIELNSIAAGFYVTDAMLKAADVELLVARSICSGKYMVIIGGEVAAVRSSVEIGQESWEAAVIDSMTIPNVHPSVFPAIAGSNRTEARGALGILESFSVASLIEGADAAVKAARVELIEIRLAMALGGKAFATMTGNVAAVQAAIDAGAVSIGMKGLLVNKVVIASPSPQLYQEYI